ARVVRSEFGALTGPSSAARADIVRGYLRDRGGVAADQLRVLSEQPARDGISHLRLEQQADGMRVYGAYVKAAVGADGELLQVIDRTAPVGPVAPASVNEQAALRAAVAELGYQIAVPAPSNVHGNVTTFAAVAELQRAPSVERVAYVDAQGTLRTGFVVETWTTRHNLLDYTLVGSDGAVVSVDRRTSNDRYNVFVEDPSKGAQTIVTAGITAESPSGWLGTGSQTTQNISGNNAHAYLDTDANNAPDNLAGAVSVTNGDFLTAADLTVTPATVGNRNVAAQNLFYLNNTVHDVLYRHGFTEAAGNFQVNNFGKGGAGNDPVNAEAQDGSGLDNANFATPNDGSSPRMQMFLWSGTSGDAFVTVGATDFGAFSSQFGVAVTATGIAGPLAIAVDSTAPTSDACDAIPAGSLTGKVAIVDRGTCNFTVKVLNAQNAGAVAVVIVNNTADGAFSPGGTERKVKIPSAMVTLANGTTLKGLVGSSGRLRQNPSPLRLDGDIDADVVFHEYGHGLTQRMIGGMSGAIAGAIGEGASDTNAFLINGDDVIGEYAFGSPAGIRSQPYSTYVGSYKTSVTGTEVHADGELYAAIMWRVMVNYLAAGLTVSNVQDDWVNGFNFTPSTPAYEDMRDGMLAGTAAARQCLIWEAFAHYGVGVGADGTVSARGTVTITESFTQPATCP
ncbi:MAG TPA: M36 family metallopeptidase, partial [Kofleriaceae bacterium]|nr:M36 family metallopeptidase [Kofleriaceae bacterium]